MKKISQYLKKETKKEFKHLQCRLTAEKFARISMTLEKQNISAQDVMMAGFDMFLEEFENAKEVPRTK